MKICQYSSTNLNFVFYVVPDPKNNNSEDSLRHTER